MWSIFSQAYLPSLCLWWATCSKKRVICVFWIAVLLSTFLTVRERKVLVAQLCLTLCDPMDCSLSGSSVHKDSPGKNTGGSSYFLLQGIFPVQGLNPGCLYARQILYRLSHQGSSWATKYTSKPWSYITSHPLHSSNQKDNSVDRNVEKWDRS